MELTREYLLWLFHYDRENGKLYWKNHWSASKRTLLVGKEAGNVGQHGYVHIGISQKYFKLHRLIWFLETNQWPKDTVDHINGNKLDNRFVNLRVVTNRQNCSNKKHHRRGRLVGASVWKRDGNWMSKIQINGKVVHLGYFNTELEAHQRYMQELKARGLG